MLWQSIVLSSFLILSTQSVNISCYVNGTETDCDTTSTYCSIADSFTINWNDNGSYTLEPGTEQACAGTNDDDDDNNFPSFICDVFGLVDSCGTITITDTEYDFNNGFNCTAPLTKRTATYDDRTQCCTSNLCNNAFSSSCPKNSDLQYFFDDIYECQETFSDGVFNSYVHDMYCDTQTTTTINACASEYQTYSANNFGCMCGAYASVYASSSAANQALLISSLSEDVDSVSDTDAGCHQVGTCNITNGFYTYQVTTSYVTLSLLIMNVVEDEYDVSSMPSDILDAINNNEQDIDYVAESAQIVVTNSEFLDTNLTLTANIQFGDLSNATYFKSGLDDGIITIDSVNSMESMILSSSTVMQTTFINVNGTATINNRGNESFALFGINIQFITFYGIVFITIIITNLF